MSPRVWFSAFGWIGVVLLAACSEPESEPNGSGERVWIEFVDADTDFVTTEVHDSNREVVRFDGNASAMVSATGTSVGGWTTQGNELDWASNSVAFRVLFGFELGERRAYFTETASGTICDLDITGPDQLGIFSTSEPPPQEP